MPQVTWPKMWLYLYDGSESSFFISLQSSREKGAGDPFLLEKEDAASTERRSSSGRGPRAATAEKHGIFPCNEKEENFLLSEEEGLLPGKELSYVKKCRLLGRRSFLMEIHG